MLLAIGDLNKVPSMNLVTCVLIYGSWSPMTFLIA